MFTEIMKKVIQKPWGKEEEFVLNSMCSVKILNVKPHARTSLQYHSHRDEFWRVLEPCKVWIGRKKINAKKGDEFRIKRKMEHRLEGLNKEGKILEISFGKFDKDDIARVEDDYGRKK